jgi:hypothetical protein
MYPPWSELISTRIQHHEYNILSARYMATYTDPQLTVETLRDKLPKNPTREIDVLRSSSPTGGKYLKK